MSARPWTIDFLTGMLALALIGCRDPHQPVSVEGRLTLNGAPVAGAMVNFILDGGDGKEGRMAYGRTDKNGVFRLTTLNPNDGALPGAYRVIVTKSEPVAPGVPIPTFPNTPEGRAERENFLDRAYGSKPRTRNLLPGRYANPETTPFRATVPVHGQVVLEMSGN